MTRPSSARKKRRDRSRSRSRYYPGKISRDRGEDTYDIDYDDGERETRVAKRLIKKKGGSRSPSPKRGRKLREGAKVQCRYRGRSKFYPGRIERDRGDGTYDIYCSRHRVYTQVFFSISTPSTRRV